MNATAKTASPSVDLLQLDALTGGAFKAPTSGERAARLREWLASEPTLEQMTEVYRELAHRDKGAAKALKDKLDELKRTKAQDAMAAEWAAKAQALLAQPRLNLADAMGWQREAAKAGAPLSREPLAGLRLALSERMKALEDLQHRVMVEREAAVLLAQRIELLSTKPWAEAQALSPALHADVQAWLAQSSLLAQDVAWASLEPKYAQQLETSRNQLSLVWEAFAAALAQALAAAQDAHTPLPAVPVWADELRASRAEAAPAPAAAAVESGPDAAQRQARSAQAMQAVGAALAALNAELQEGHSKAAPKAAAALRQALKEHGRHIEAALEAEVQAALGKSSELEDWQRWRANQLREELLARALALVPPPEQPRPSGRKVQEALRQLREQWKATDHGGTPNHALWKKFDDACNEAHKIVEAWLEQIKQQSEASRAQRLALIEEVQAWAAAHANSSDWKQQQRELHALAERWRQGGHLSEKLFAELQPLWKAAMAQAHQMLEAAQSASVERRQVLIEQAQALGQAQPLRIDAVRALQQRWQQEAQAVPLDRRLEQKLWEAFRQPIDAAFARKTQEREQGAAALSAHDQAVLQAAQALEAACTEQDAQRIRSATQALQALLQGASLPAGAQAEAASAAAAGSTAPTAAAAAADPADATAATGADNSPVQLAEPAAPAAVPDAGANAGPATAAAAATSAATATSAAPVRKLVAMRGDDRPGTVRAVPGAATRPGRDERRPGHERDGRDGRDFGRDGGRDSTRPAAGAAGARFERGTAGWDARSARASTAPRLGDAAFRAQRHALEQAELALKKLAAQAHGQTVLDVLAAWQQRDAQRLPAAGALGGKAAAAARSAWTAALAPGTRSPADAAKALLRLELAAELPTPAAWLEQRRALQLQMLTRRQDPPPAQTWTQDLTQVLASPYDASAAERLQAVLKVLLRR